MEVDVRAMRIGGPNCTACNPPERQAQREKEMTDWLINAVQETCLHNSCPKCHGTGRDSIGRSCIHMIDCPHCRPRL